MSDVSINGVPALKWSVTFARRGNWRGSFVFTDETVPTGAVTGSMFGDPIAGFARRSAAPYLQSQMFMVGGAGNLNQSMRVDPRDFRYASFAEIVTQLIEDGGEVVASDVLVGRDQQFSGWTRFRTPIAPELESLCGQRTDGTDWRVRPSDGQIEVRPLQTRATSPSLVLISDHVAEHRRVYAMEDETVGLVVMPGDQFDGITADTVEYQGDPQKNRIIVYYGPTQYDRATELWQELIDVSVARYRNREADALGYYMGTVRDVRGNGNIDVLCDDPRVGYVNDVPLYNGLPGWQVKPVAGSSGARVLVGWSGGDKTHKVAFSWGAQPAATLDSAQIEAQTLVQYQVPMHRVIGTSEVVSGDDRTEHDIGIGEELLLTDCTIKPGAGALGSVQAISGTDSAFTVTIQADPTNNPPANGGPVVEVRFKRAYASGPRGTVCSAADDKAGILGPGAAASATAITISISKGMTKGAVYKFTCIVKG